MPRFLPDRSRRRGERRIGECTESDANMVGSPIQVPIDRSAAFWTETEPDLPALLDLANVDLAGSFGSNLGLLEIDTDAEGCACASLTFEAVTSDDGGGFARGFHPQRAAATMSNPGHRSSSLKDPYKLVSQAECGIRVRR